MNKKYKCILIVLNILIFLFYMITYISSTCMCGHHRIKIIPSIIFTIIQIVLLIKFNKYEKWNLKQTLIFIVCSVLVYALVFVLSLNDMNELHNIDVI